MCRLFTKSWNVFFYSVLTLFFFNSCSAGSKCLVGERKINNCETLNTFRLADSSGILDFQHRCSETRLSHGYRGSYALFEYQRGSQKAVAVGKVKAGWVFGVQAIQGVSLIPDKLRIQSFSSWGQQPFGLALQTVNLKTKQSSTGSFVTGYFHRVAGGGESSKNFQLDSNGSLTWERLLEPESRKKGRGMESNMPKGSLRLNSRDIGSLENSYRLNILIRNQSTAETVTLSGPVIENLSEKLNVEKPASRTLGLADSLNPRQEGGLFDFLKTAFKGKNCIYLRKQSKYELDKRF